MIFVDLPVAVFETGMKIVVGIVAVKTTVAIAAAVTGMTTMNAPMDVVKVMDPATSTVTHLLVTTAMSRAAVEATTIAKAVAAAMVRKTPTEVEVALSMAVHLIPVLTLALTLAPNLAPTHALILALTLALIPAPILATSVTHVDRGSAN